MNRVSRASAETQIQQDLKSHPETMAACLRLLNWLLAQPEEATKHLTFNRLRISAELSAPPSLGPVLDYLTGARLPLLVTRYELIEGDDVIPVEPEEIVEAEKTGAFYHPLTGYALPDFESKLFVHFELNDEVLSREAE